VGKQAVKATPSSAYSMQKTGYSTQHLAMELADYIIVNAVSPAVVNTTLYHGVFLERSSRKGT
jgi:NAD(P)-dependent dehydrogenase (short-subunit alcohol dehydrogenase family)